MTRTHRFSLIAAAAILSASQATAFDQNLSNSLSAQASAAVAKCSTGQCVSKAYRAVTNKLSKKPDYRPVVASMNMVAKAARKACKKGCSQAEAGKVLEVAKQQQAKVAATGKEYLTAFVPAFNIGMPALGAK